MRLVILGNSGSGKSSVARAVAARHGVTHLDLDSIVWEPGQIAVQRDMRDIHADLDAFLASHVAWVIEGCYAELAERALARCTRLLFLNPGVAECLRNNEERAWEPHKYASKDEQDQMLSNLRAWVADYWTRDDAWSYNAHRRVFDGYSGEKLEVDQARPTLEDLGLD